MYDTIIFDLGGVIEKINPLAVIEEFKKMEVQNAENFFNLFKQDEKSSLFELGIIQKDDFICDLKSRCKTQVSASFLESVWCANQLGVSEETVDVLSKLKELGLKLVVLSNTNCIHTQHIEKVFSKTHQKNFKDLFDNVYYSFEIHLRKPHEATYLHVLDSSHLSPKRCIYIDDLKANLVIPKKLGMHCIHHITNTELNTIPAILKFLKVHTF